MKIRILDEFTSANEALQHVDASGRGTAIRIEDRFLVVDDEMVRELECAGAAFTVYDELPMSDGSSDLVAVPVN